MKHKKETISDYTEGAEGSQEVVAKAITAVLVVLSIALILFNLYQLNQVKSLFVSDLSGPAPASASIDNSVDQSIIPTGAPKIYGQELDISFDDVSPNDPQKADETIRKLGLIDVNTNIEGKDLDRYINILYKLENGISCEYCCGARAIIFENGQPACGCAHSFAMRGLAKYLIIEHSSEYTDEEILEELGKWKTLFFPGVMSQKAKVLKDNGIEFNYINLASNKYRGIESQAASGAGGMVGGC